MIPPEKISGSFSVKKVWDYLNRLRDYVISITPRQGHGTRVHVSALGSMVSAQPGDKTIEGDSEMRFRGIWFQDQQYKEGDVVMVRGGIEGAGPEALGTFYCVRDHTSTDINYPRELTEQQVDPESGHEDDLWRTFAAGAWPSLTIKAFPIPVVGGDPPPPPIDLAAYTLIDAGRVGCFGVSGIAGIDGVGGTASGSTPGSGNWELTATDLPAAEVVKFRLLTLCIGGEKFTAYFAMSAPKAVP